MVKTIRFILYFIVLSILCLGCDTQPQQQSQTPKSQSSASKKEESKAAEERDYAWPPDREGEEVNISKNLLTKNFYVVLDGSGSMDHHGCSGDLTKLAAAKIALEKFAQLVPSDANLGLLVFNNGKIYEKVALSIDNRNQFISEVNLTRASGGTPLASALKTGYLQIEKQARRQLGYGEYTLVTVTDGEASQGQDPTKIVNWILGSSPVQIHTIGFCIGTDHSLNIPGRTVYKPADSPDQLQRGLQDVLAEAEQFDVTDFQ